jgi:holo-ACP synthase CitX
MDSSPNSYDLGERSTALSALLRGREERALVQQMLLHILPTVVQISLNIPGYPKRMPGDEAAIQAAECALYVQRVRPSARMQLVNAAGIALLLGCHLPPQRAKLAAIDLEKSQPCGRVLDVDVVSASGPLSRTHLGVAPRRCLLCNDDAKACGRLGRHGTDELRARISAILGLL